MTDIAKPLDWHRSRMIDWNGDYHTVPTGYTVRCADENGWKWSVAGGFGYASSTGRSVKAGSVASASMLRAVRSGHLMPT